MKNILIVGAGAVGQVYGYHFANAGHNVTFLIKEKHEAKLQRGLVLYNLKKDSAKSQPIHFNNFNIVTRWEQASSKAPDAGWDQIVLCISSTALENFDFSGLLSALKESTTVLMMQPGPRDYQRVARHIPEHQIVQGVITLLSYMAPMAVESVPVPGIAFWLPPLAKTPFIGPKKRCEEVITTFKSSGMPATLSTKLREKSPFSTAAFMVLLTALEASDWQFKRLRDNHQSLHDTEQAIKQAFNAISKDLETPAPLWRYATSPWMLKLLLMSSPKVVPMDLEAFFKTHFLKVKDQTKLFMNTYIETAEQHHIDAQNLIALNGQT